MEPPNSGYPKLGKMLVPKNFKYTDVLQRGRPQHGKWDSFQRRHPPMTVEHWAKIFSPFDALDGFDERIAEKEVVYACRTELSPDDQAELDRRLDILRNLTYNSRMARENRVMVRVISFVPCTDENHFAFRIAAGKYETTAGMVLRVEPDSLRLRTENGDRNILFCDLREIQSEAGIFNRAWAET